MSRIRILSEQLINKISAGEVVQRPASVVKELVENSIDAGADEVLVVVKNGGKTLCEVVDNGFGMSKDDLLLAFERHATSKIESTNDLLNIRTLGFRGEALASISAVSRVSAISTEKDSDVGYELVVEGGNFRNITPSSPKSGTTISVRNLFHNVPARRKFLKSAEVEFRHIVETLRKFALINPHIKFELIHNEREIFNLRQENLKERITHLFSSEYGENLLPLNYSNDVLKVTGYIGNLNLVRARRGEQYFYVNRRSVTDYLMNNAIITGYSSLISRGEFPFYCINLEIPPQMVDVNVHPAKIEVKFSNQNQVYQFLKNSVENSLGEIAKVIPDLGRFYPETFYAPPKLPKSLRKEGKDSSVSLDKKNTLFEDLKRKTKGPDEVPVSESELEEHFSSKVEGDVWKKRAERFSKELTFQEKEIFQVEVPVLQVHNKYIISPVRSGLIIIDQHVAHERILYEAALDSMERKNWKSQQLLFPQVVELSVTDYSVLLEILPFLEKVGFHIKEFGKNSVAVEAVPAGMRWGNENSVIKEIIDHYQEYGTKDMSMQKRVAASYACKAAIKSGDPLSEEEMRNLFDRLFATKNPYYCPHGRPIIVNLTLKELDKRFERT